MRGILSTLALSAALLAPIATVAHADKKIIVYTDRVHHDRHNWDAAEDARYRDYLREHHRTYVEFGHLKHHDQDAYWTWRHDHEH